MFAAVSVSVTSTDCGRTHPEGAARESPRRRGSAIACRTPDCRGLPSAKRCGRQFRVGVREQTPDACERFFDTSRLEWLFHVLPVFDEARCETGLAQARIRQQIQESR